AALSGRRARHRYGHNTCSSAKGWPCKSTNVLPCIITSAWGNQEQPAGSLPPPGSAQDTSARWRPGRLQTAVGGVALEGCAPGPEEGVRGAESSERRRRRRRKPEGEHRTIVRMTRVASSRGRDRRAAAARKSGARPRRRGGAHGGCERAASAPVRESAGGPVGRAGRRSEEHEEREERGETGEDEEEHDSLLQRALRLLTPGGGSAGGKTGFFSRTAGREIGRKMAPDLTLNTVGDAPVVRHHQFLRPGSAHMHKSV
ncbi:unnamed protein product, partial [Prorocentrum cordatum]